MTTHPFARADTGRAHGRGLTATADIRAGEVIWRMEAPFVPHDEGEIRTWSAERQARFFRLSVQIGNTTHAGSLGDDLHDDPFVFTNHSCDPNTWWTKGMLVAMRAICAGEEISFDYATSEIRPDFNIASCHCGAQRCRGAVGPHDLRDPELRARYGDHLPRHVLETLGPRPWWSGSLQVGSDGLLFAGRSVRELARQTGTPVYLYDARRVSEQVATLRTVFSANRLSGRVYYALKANRFRPLLGRLLDEGDVGIDACSPREVDWALETGFSADRVSVTASALTHRDLARLAAARVHVNLDNVSAIRRYSDLVPRGTAIGLRIDPEEVVGYGVNEKMAYAGGKLGLALETFEEARAVAESCGLVVDTVHMHLGWGLRESDSARVEAAFARLADVASRVATLGCVNVGGGLGARLTTADRPLDPFVWGAILARTLGGLGVPVACEPGTFLVADAGALVVEVAAAWTKRGVDWIAIDAGHAVNVYPAHYGLPLEIVPVARPLAPAETELHVAGNINESGDIFARARPLPRLREGELLALMPAGAYGASMASDHCLRGQPAELLIG